MADFRKISIALAVVALMLGFGLTANAQPNQINCTANGGGTPPTVRAEGFAELAQDILVNCTSVSPTANVQLNLSVYGTTNFTSRILTSAGTTVAQGVSALNPDNFTEATLIVNETATAIGTNVYRGKKVSESQLSWPTVTVNPTGTNFTLRITNIRVNATQGSAGAFIPGQISAYVTMSSNNVVLNAVTLSNSTPIPIAIAQQSYTFSTAGTSGGLKSATDGGKDYNQCSDLNGNLTSSDNSKTVGTDFSVAFAEKFAQAFKMGGSPTSGTPALTNGTSNVEYGYVNTALLGNETGIGSPGNAGTQMGTRFIVRFSNIPAGANVYVATNPGRVTKADGTVDTTFSKTVYSDVNGLPVAGDTTFNAILITGTDANGVGGTAATTSDSYLAQNANKQNYGVTKLTPDATGSAMAVWEVVASDPAVLETMVAPVIVKWSSNVKNNTPAAGTATVTGSLAPAYVAGAGADTSKAGQAIPRFLETGSPSVKLFNVKTCTTTLLFPYVTSFTGFDTGIAIANTSMDPFSSANVNGGNCTLNFYNAGKATKVTTKTINAGETLAFSLTGGVPQDDGTFSAISVSPNGYMIAQCNFIFAHGYAFISDLGIKNWAQGYLALVMGNSSSRDKNPSSAGEYLTGN